MGLAPINEVNHLTLRFKLTGIFWHISFETLLLCFESTVVPSLLHTLFSPFFLLLASLIEIYGVFDIGMDKIQDPKWTMVYEVFKIIILFLIEWIQSYCVTWEFGCKRLDIFKLFKYKCIIYQIRTFKCIYSIILPLVRQIFSPFYQSLSSIQSNISEIF